MSDKFTLNNTEKVQNERKYNEKQIIERDKS